MTLNNTMTIPDNAIVYPDTDKTKYRDGYIADLRKARKNFACKVCQLPIEPGSKYYAIVIGGGGLGSLKFPDRTHKHCLEAYFGKPTCPHDDRTTCRTEKPCTTCQIFWETKEGR